MLHRTPWIWVLVSSFTFLQCGKVEIIDRSKDGYTTVRFNGPNSKSLTSEKQFFASQTGGIMIYAIENEPIGIATGESVKLPDENGSAALVLPNGDYRFYGVSYAQNNLGGDPLCAFDEGPVTLDGANKTINLDFQSANCSASTHFSIATFMDGNEFLDLKLHSCNNSTNVPVYSANCPPAGGGGPGANVSARLELSEYKRSNGNTPTYLSSGIHTNCVTIPNNSASTDTIKVPFGNALPLTGPFHIRVKAYQGAACTGTESTYTFDTGISNGASPFRKNGNTSAHLYLIDL